MILNYPTPQWLYCRILVITLTSNVRTGVWTKYHPGWEHCSDVCVTLDTLDYASTAQFPIHNRYANYADEYSNRPSFDFRGWPEAQNWLGLICQIFLYLRYGLHDNTIRYPLYEIRCDDVYVYFFALD